MKKLNQNGTSHLIIPVFVVLVIVAIGTYVITKSHADSLTTASTTSTSTTPTSHRYADILGPAQAPQTVISAQSSVPYSFVGSQTVNVLNPGQALAYTQGVKGNVKSCFDVYVQQPKSGTVTATVEFANNNNAITRNLVSTSTNDLQEVCVSPGTSTNPGFNIKNISTPSPATGPTIEVYRDTLSW